MALISPHDTVTLILSQDELRTVIYGLAAIQELPVSNWEELKQDGTSARKLIKDAEILEDELSVGNAKAAKHQAPAEFAIYTVLSASDAQLQEMKDKWYEDDQGQPSIPQLRKALSAIAPHVASIAKNRKEN